MYNPINRVLRATKDASSYKRRRPHWSVSALEVAALLSFLPGMFIFLYSFVLSAAILFAAFEVEKGNSFLATAVFALFGVLPGLFGILAAVSVSAFTAKGLALAAIYGGLGVFGIVVSSSQRKSHESCS